MAMAVNPGEVIDFIKNKLSELEKTSNLIGRSLRNIFFNKSGKNKHVVSLPVKAVKLTGNTIIGAMNQFKKSFMNGNLSFQDTMSNAKNKEILKQLKNNGLNISQQDVQISDLKLLKKVMANYEIDYAIKKFGKEDYSLFFNTQDLESLISAFERYEKEFQKNIEKEKSKSKEIVKDKKIEKETIQDKTQHKSILKALREKQQIINKQRDKDNTHREKKRTVNRSL